MMIVRTLVQILNMDVVSMVSHLNNITVIVVVHWPNMDVVKTDILLEQKMGIVAHVLRLLLDVVLMKSLQNNQVKIPVVKSQSLDVVQMVWVSNLHRMMIVKVKSVTILVLIKNSVVAEMDWLPEIIIKELIVHHIYQIAIVLLLNMVVALTVIQFKKMFMDLIAMEFMYKQDLWVVIVV